jgi:hypothetical protein
MFFLLGALAVVAVGAFAVPHVGSAVVALPRLAMRLILIYLGIGVLIWALFVATR